MKSILAIILLLFCSVSFAQSPTDQIQDKAVIKDQARQDRATVVLADDLEEKTAIASAEQDEANIAANTAQDEAAKIVTAGQDARMDAIESQLSGDQKFWLEILKTVASIMTAVGLPLMLAMLTRAQRDRASVMQSVNGMSTQVALTARAEGFFEGAKLAARANDDPKAANLLDERSKIISHDVDEVIRRDSKEVGIGSAEDKT
jgi:hypothetical protein